MERSTFVLASVADPSSVKTWSGIPHYIVETLKQKNLKVITGGPLEAVEPWFYRWVRPFFWRLGLGWFYADFEPGILRQRAKNLEKELSGKEYAAIISIHAEPIAAFSTKKPCILIHDCTFDTLVDYYDAFTSLSRRSLRLGHQLYQSALDRCALAVFSSQWAADSAIVRYNVSPKKVAVIEFGANLSAVPVAEDIERFLLARENAPELRLLMVGVEWKRKGGEDAWRLVSMLRDLGYPAILDVVGCTPPAEIVNSPFCRSHGFLNKQRPEERNRLTSLFEHAHFLLVPSLAECYGCVYCEANAFGLPAIGRDTGGVSQIIRPGINGFLLSQSAANLGEIAAEIVQLWNSRSDYNSLARSARDEYEGRLNWDQFADRLMSLIEALVEKPTINII